MPSLYELTSQWRELMLLIEEYEGELPLDIEERLDQIDEAWHVKVDNLRRVMAELSHRSEMRRTEAARLKESAELLNDRHEWLAHYLMEQMQRRGEKRVSTDFFDQTICKSPPRAVCTVSYDLLPDKFKRSRTTTEFDKTAALEAYKRGERLPDGVVIETDNVHLKLS